LIIIFTVAMVVAEVMTLLYA